jgi:hypothetical protein
MALRKVCTILYCTFRTITVLQQLPEREPDDRDVCWLLARQTLSGNLHTAKKMEGDAPKLQLRVDGKGVAIRSVQAYLVSLSH